MTFWQKTKKFLVDFFTKNIGTKILAILLALILWIIFAAVEDPAITETYTVPLNVLNLEEYESAGHYVHLEDGSKLSNIKLNVSVRAPKSVLQELTLSGPEKAIEASADVFDIENGILTIYYKVLDEYAGKLEFNTISNTSYLTVVSEEIISKTVNITLSLTGTPAEGYFVPETDANRNISTTTVTVSGPESLITPLDHAAVIYSLDNAKQSASDMVLYLHYFDKDGNELSLSSGICNFSATLVSANIPLYRIYAMKLKLEVIGEPLEGWSYAGDGAMSKDEVLVYALAEKTNCPTTFSVAQPVFGQSGSASWEKDLSKLISQTYPYLTLYSQDDSSLEITINFVQEELE